MFSGKARAAMLAMGLLSGGAIAQEASPLHTKQILEAFLREKLPELLSMKSDNFQLKYVEPHTAGASGGWGIDYKWNASKSSNTSTVPKNGEPFAFGRMSFDFDVQGHYVFNDVQNNQDLSTIQGALRLERGRFGKLNVLDKAISDAFQKCLLAIPFPTSPAQTAEYDRENERCVLNHGIDNLMNAQPGASYYWVDFHGGIEANQDYSDTRKLFGLAGAYAYEPSSGVPFPSLLLGVERLDAKDDDTRTALTTKTRYTRAKAEVAFNTVVASFEGALLRFNFSYRYFHEFSAPAAIKSAGFDDFDFFTASLRVPALLLPLIQSDDYEFFVSYTTGRLPFNASSDKAYEVGFSTNVRTLADFISQ